MPGAKEVERSENNRQSQNLWTEKHTELEGLISTRTPGLAARKKRAGDRRGKDRRGDRMKRIGQGKMIGRPSARRVENHRRGGVMEGPDRTGLSRGPGGTLGMLPKGGEVKEGRGGRGTEPSAQAAAMRQVKFTGGGEASRGQGSSQRPPERKGGEKVTDGCLL